MQALWRLQLTVDGLAGTTLERLTEAPPLLLPPVVKAAIGHLGEAVRDATIALVIELTCECGRSEQPGLCEKLQGEGWQPTAIR